MLKKIQRLSVACRLPIGRWKCHTKCIGQYVLSCTGIGGPQKSAWITRRVTQQCSLSPTFMQLISENDCRTARFSVFIGQNMQLKIKTCNRDIFNVFNLQSPFERVLIVTEELVTEQACFSKLHHKPYNISYINVLYTYIYFADKSTPNP